MDQLIRLIREILNMAKIWVIVQPWETGLIVRGGTKVKKLSKGFHLKIPYFDSLYVQENRLRVMPLPIQTLTTLDDKTLTMNASIGYTINSIEKLYDTLFHPESTIANIAMSVVAKYIFETNGKDIKPSEIENLVINDLNNKDFGLKFEYFKITNFAFLKAYRLIKDESWTSDTLQMDNKK